MRLTTRHIRPPATVTVAAGLALLAVGTCAASAAGVDGGSVGAGSRFAAVSSAGGQRSASVRPDTGPVLPGTHCPSFPVDNVWNTPITTLPVAKQSPEWLAAMHSSSTNLHPDYGPSGGYPYGIPWQAVPGTQPLVKVIFNGAPAESDKGPYPFSSTTPIEGGPGAGGDRHALMVNTAKCVLYEISDAYYHPDNKSTAYSGAIWNLDSNALRPAGWTSSDAAGLPILPLLVTYDQVASGTMDHAIRVTADCTQSSYLWPARHQAGSGGSNCPPMGARFRLESSFSLSAAKCSAMCQTVLKTMKTYGLILADNGSNWFFQGVATPAWTYTEVDQLKQIPASAFVAVAEGCMMVSPNSAEAYQPGTAQYKARCG